MAKQKHFKNKIIKMFIIITFIPLFLLSASNIFLVVQTRQQNIIELMNMAMDNAQEKILKYFQEKEEGLNLVLGDAINNLKEVHPQNLSFLVANAYKTSNPNYLEFIDKNGYILAKINQAGIRFNRDYLIGVPADETVYIDENNQPVAKNKTLTISSVESDVSSSPDFLTALKGESFYGPLEFLEGKPVMRLTAPMYNKNQRIIGVVSAEINLNELNRIIEKVVIGNSGYVFIATKEGQVISSGKKDKININSDINSIKLADDYLKNNYSSQDFNLYNNYLGEEMILNAQYLSEKNWFVFSEWPEEDAFSVINSILQISFWVATLVITFVAILGIIFSKQITKPIRTLRKGAKEISQGNLEHKINIKTGDEFEVLGNKFNEMIKVLKENQKLRDEFVFIAAHELRTPVTAIKGYVSMILENTFGEVPEDIKKNLLIINQSNDRLVQLVQDLLEVARSEAGKMKIEMSELGMTENVEVVVNELASLAKEKGIALNYEKTSARIKADPYKLKEVLTNIIGNAIKYTLDNGSIDIKHEEKDGFLMTSIKDRGIGMNQEEMDKLFSKFYRVQNEQTNEIEGTGLGLFICKEIIERMGGKIWVESKKGEGSTFFFTLQIA